MYPNATITIVVEYENRFLLVRRGDEVNYSTLWAFPGGKVEIGETAIETIYREVKEETNLELNDKVSFLNSYTFKQTVGFCFLVSSTNDNVSLGDGLTDFIWISDVKDMEVYPCIPGIYNHLVRAKEVIRRGIFDSLGSLNLVKDKYINTK